MEKNITKKKFKIYQIILIVLFYIIVLGLIFLRFSLLFYVKDSDNLTYFNLPFYYNIDIIFLCLLLINYTVNLFIRRTRLYKISLSLVLISLIIFSLTILISQNLFIGVQILLIFVYLLLVGIVVISKYTDNDLIESNNDDIKMKY